MYSTIGSGTASQAAPQGRHHYARSQGSHWLSHDCQSMPWPLGHESLKWTWKGKIFDRKIKCNQSNLIYFVIKSTWITKFDSYFVASETFDSGFDLYINHCWKQATNMIACHQPVWKQFKQIATNIFFYCTNGWFVYLNTHQKQRFGAEKQIHGKIIPGKCMGRACSFTHRVRVAA